MNVIKKYLLLVLLVIFVTPAFAQLDTVRSNKNEFCYGYGIGPSTSMRFLSQSPFSSTGDKIGAVYFVYTYRLNKVIGLGFTICYDPVNLTYYDELNGGRIPVCKVKETNFSVMPHLKINWLNSKYVNLYSKVALYGIHYFSYQQEEFHPELYEVTPPEHQTVNMDIFQFTPVGIEVGTKQYAGFLQIGVGIEGLISLGFRYGLKDEE